MQFQLILLCRFVTNGNDQAEKRSTLPIAGIAIPILDTTTCTMACLAAFGDSPNRFPFSSVTGIPYFNSLIVEKNKHHVKLSYQLLKY